MSLLWKATQIFCSLGVAGTVPLFWADPLEKPRYFVAPPAVVGTSVAELIKAGYQGCSTLQGFRGGSLLYMCWFLKIDGTNEPSIFNYNRTRDISDRIKQVSQITSRELKYVDGKTDSLKTDAFFWINKWQGKELIPSKHCTLPRNSKSFKTLTCKHPSLQQETSISLS